MKGVFVLFALVGASSAMPQGVNLDVYSTRISNGTAVTRNSIPYQAFIVPSENEVIVRRCSGILISQNYVLTSASCVANLTSVDVKLGVHNWIYTERTQVELTSTSLLLKDENSVALIELPSPVELTSAIAIANLSAISNTNLEGRTAKISGWGGVDLAAINNVDEILKSAYETIAAVSVCESAYENVDDGDICLSGDNGVSLCTDDKGIPIVVDDQVVGLGRFGPTGCVTGPSVFSSIYESSSWIVENSDVTSIPTNSEYKKDKLSIFYLTVIALVSQCSYSLRP